MEEEKEIVWKNPETLKAFKRYVEIYKKGMKDMMWEEFVKLSGVWVSYRYYTECIEPEYMATENVEKAEFCQAWKADNKRLLHTCLTIDTHNLNRDVSVMDAIKSDEIRYRDTLNQHETMIKRLEEELKAEKESHDRTTAEWERSVQNAATWEGQYKDMKAECTTLHKVNEELRGEIVSLKAAMYDLLVQTKQVKLNQ